MATGPPLILVVDQHADTRDLYSALLTDAGYNVAEAEEAAEAFDRARALHPDLIVTELLLRGSSGLELAAELQRDPSTKDIPLLAITADIGLNFGRAASNGAFTAVVLKPCPPIALMEQIRVALEASADARRDAANARLKALEPRMKSAELRERSRRLQQRPHRLDRVCVRCGAALDPNLAGSSTRGICPICSKRLIEG